MLRETLIELKIIDNQKVFIAGDFNCPKIDWKSVQLGEQVFSLPPADRYLLDIANDFALSQHVTIPTRKCNSLDLIFTNFDDPAVNVDVQPGFGDNAIVVGKLFVKTLKTPSQKRNLFIYKKANWDSFRSELTNRLPSFTKSRSSRSAEENWLCIKSLVLELMARFIPTKEYPVLNKYPWVTHNLRKMLNKKRKIHALAKRTQSVSDWEKYRKIRNDCSDLDKKLYNEFISNALDDGDHSKSFWKFLKSKKQDCGIPPISDQTGQMCTDPQVKGNIFNQYFNSVFTPATCNNSDFELNPNTEYMPDICFTLEGINKLLKHVKTSKAAGPDGIPARVLKQVAEELSPYLLILFQQIFNTGHIPSDWKEALVVPIFKNENKHAPENYRPVSLTSLICKVFEHIIYSNVVTHLTNHKLLSPGQHGFSKNLSCETQATALLHDLCASMDNKKQVDLIFLDFSKAFDRVSHDILIKKLFSLCPNEKLKLVVKNFLSDRSQRVIVEGSTSDLKPVTSGVPQGSVLGPLLFLVYINDLNKDISSDIRLFADDTVLYREILNSDDHFALQNDLNLIEKWCIANEMSLNIKKCNVMSVCRLHQLSDFEYKLSKCSIERVSVYKYLGIYVSSDLSWDAHINFICSKANRALGFIRRQLGKCSQEVKLKAYTSLVRPHLEYASCAWDPHVETQINQVEMVQHRAVRFILGQHSRFDSVTEMLLKLGLNTLESRRKNARLCLFFKIDKVLTPLITPRELQLKTVQRRSDNGRAYEHFICHSNPLFSSFYPRTVRDWNLLPDNLVSLGNLETFSAHLGDQRPVSLT